MSKSIPKLALDHGTSVRTIWREVADGILTVTKVRDRTIVTDRDEAEWLARRRKVTANTANLIVDSAVEKIEAVGKAVADGQVDRAQAAARLAAAAAKTGLIAA